MLLLLSNELGFVFYSLKSCIYIGDLLPDFLYYIQTQIQIGQREKEE